MNRFFFAPNFAPLLGTRAYAFARLMGDAEHPRLTGLVRFYRTAYGTLTAIECSGLPTGEGSCDSPVFGLHIHTDGSCTGSGDDPFMDVGMHYNPNDCPHPYHAGDLPPIFGANGYAFSAFLTDRFTVEEIVGRSVILHAAPDDFTTQPSGNSGKKIACGEIRTGALR